MTATAEARWAIGIDPGLTETGVVLSREDSKRNLVPVSWASFKSPTGDEDLPRVVALAGNIVNLLIEWVDEYAIEEVDIAIEYPVLRRNPAGFFKQVRLYQEIESGVFHIVAGLLNECWVTEINPVTSKALAGVGKKEKPTDVSPFANHDLPLATKEALADAWAHSLGTWRVAKSSTRLPFHGLTSSDVKQTSGQTRDPWMGFVRNLREAGL